MISGAWSSVSLTTITNCWRKVKLLKFTDEVYNQLEVPTESNEGDVGDVNKIWDQVTAQFHMPPAVTFADYVTRDKDAQALAELTTEEITNSAHQEDPITDKNDDDYDFDDLEENDVPGSTEVVRSTNTIRAYLDR